MIIDKKHANKSLSRAKDNKEWLTSHVYYLCDMIRPINKSICLWTVWAQLNKILVYVHLFNKQAKFKLKHDNVFMNKSMSMRPKYIYIYIYLNWPFVDFFQSCHINI